MENFKWPIIGLLTVSCSSHPTPVPHAAAHKLDTVPRSAVLSKVSSPSVRRQSTPTESFTIDLNNDGLPDTITIATSGLDIGGFNTIRISLNNFSCTTFTTDKGHPWTSVDDWFFQSNRSALPTRRFFITTTKTQAVLLLFGDIDGAGYRDNFSIIDIEGNLPKLVLSQNDRHLAIESPVGLRDVDEDGRLEFVYRQIFEYDGTPDTLGGKIGVYSPYFVYTVDSNCVLNKLLTKRYNEIHYVFAGLSYDENIKVFYPNDDSKPRLLKQ